MDELDGIAANAEAQMIVIYGRRRIGKTSLLRHWAEQHAAPSVYWTGYRTTSELLLESFSHRLAEITPGVTSDGLNFRTWEAAFMHLFTLAAKEAVIAVIDEFPYLVEMEPSIPSLLQRLWDEHAGNSRLLLAICGSHYHMMHEEFASSRKPLFGRARRHLIVDEIEPKDLSLFLPRYSPEQIVETYGVTGGVPAYLELWDDQRPVFHNIRELLLRPSTFFSQEALLLIQDEIAEPRTYLGLLQALGGGLKTPKQIADIAGIRLNHVGKYLKTLVDLRFVRRVLSEDTEERMKSRNTKYEIRDPYLRFHFHFLYAHPDRRGAHAGNWLFDHIQEQFPSYIGKNAFEELARQQITAWGDSGELPFTPQYVGRAWNREAEIDVVAINWRDRAVLFGECKWTNAKMPPTALTSLQDRAAKLTKLKGFKAHYALFSKKGFTASALKEANAAMMIEGATFRRVTG